MSDHRQELFDRISKHLITQGERAVEEGSSGATACRYRTEDGKSCAVGCLIKDEYYNPDMEGVAYGASSTNPDDLRSIMVREAVSKSLGYKPNEGEAILLVAMQCLHDNSHNWVDIKKSLRNRAFELGLVFNE